MIFMVERGTPIFMVDRRTLIFMMFMICYDLIGANLKNLNNPRSPYLQV